MAIGDVLAVVAAGLAIFGSTWALLVASALMFGGRTTAAQRSIELHPWRCFGIGLLLALPFGTLAVALAAQPLPLLKLVGTCLYLTLFALAALGGGGLASAIGRRCSALDPSLSALQALGRGSGVLVGASLFPLLGWFLLGPAIVLVSLGAGVLSLVARSEAPPIAREGF
jgi:hypothetical protein